MKKLKGAAAKDSKIQTNKKLKDAAEEKPSPWSFWL